MSDAKFTAREILVISPPVEAVVELLPTGSDISAAVADEVTVLSVGELDSWESVEEGAVTELVASEEFNELEVLVVETASSISDIEVIGASEVPPTSFAVVLRTLEDGTSEDTLEDAVEELSGELASEIFGLDALFSKTEEETSGDGTVPVAFERSAELSFKAGVSMAIPSVTSSGEIPVVWIPSEGEPLEVWETEVSILDFTICSDCDVELIPVAAKLEAWLLLGEAKEVSDEIVKPFSEVESVGS